MPLLREKAGVGVPVGPLMHTGSDVAVAWGQLGERVGEGGGEGCLWVRAYWEFIPSSLPFPARREMHARTLLPEDTHRPQQRECKPPLCIGDVGVRDSRGTMVWLSGLAVAPGGAWCLHAASPRPRCEGAGWSQRAARRLALGTQEPIRDTIACRRKGLAVPVPTRAAVRAQGCLHAPGLHILPSFSNSLTSNPNGQPPQPFGQP